MNFLHLKQNKVFFHKTWYISSLQNRNLSPYGSYMDKSWIEAPLVVLVTNWPTGAIYQRNSPIAIHLLQTSSLTAGLLGVQATIKSNALLKLQKAVTISKLSLFPGCHYFQAVTISRLSLFPGCHYFQAVTISRLSLFPGCHYFQAVTISRLSLFPGPWLTQFTRVMPRKNFRFTQIHAIEFTETAFPIISLY